MSPAGSRIVAGGWWVVPAALLVCGAVVFVVARSTFDPAGSKPIPQPRIVLEPAAVPRGAIAAAAPPDRLRALVAPTFLTVAQVERRNEEERGKLLVSSDRVVGVVGPQGVARAYPLRLIRWHEAVNDTFGGVPLAITYSGLADLAAAYHRQVDGEVLVLGVSGRLWQSTSLLHDRRADGPSSLWSPLDGRAVAGPMTGSTLALQGAAVTTWDEWRRRHPDTEVLAPDPEAESVRLYRRDPYHSYFGSDVLRFPVAPLPGADGLRLKDHVLEVVVDGSPVRFALPRLAAAAAGPAGTVEHEVGGEVLRVHFRLEPPVAWAETADGRLPPQRFGFWFALHAAAPGLEPLPVR